MMKDPRTTLALLLVLVVSLPSVASGQQLQPSHTLTLEGVKTVVTGAEAEAQANGWHVVIVVADANGELLFLERMDGVQLGSLDIAQQKARTAARYRRPTKAFADRLAGGNQSTLALPGVIPLEGGLPIVVDDEVIGAVGVSGVRGDQDAQIAEAGIALLLQRISE